MTFLRQLFLLDPDVVFLNHGSCGACPRPVFDDYQRWQLELEALGADVYAGNCHNRESQLLRNATLSMGLA